MRKVREVGALLIDWYKSDSDQGYCLLSLTLALDSSEVPRHLCILHFGLILMCLFCEHELK